MRFLLSLLFSFIFTLGFSQKLPFLSIDFEDANGNPYINAQAGGLQAPQFTEIDLNNDGIKDLLIFDRLGNILMPFINDGTTNGENYHYDLSFIKFFPDNLIDFISIHDFNGDGVEDIFSTSVEPGIPGFSVFKGSRDSDGFLHFEVEKSVLRYPSSSNGFLTNIPLLKGDYPAIVDVDFDGDLDIITFGIGGGNVDWYRNYSVERNFGKDSLLFELETNCWGGFYESGISTVMELADQSGDCANGFVPDNAGSRHAGSTLAAIDMNNDQAIEMAIGDVSFPTINMLSNGGTKKKAWINDQDPTFPSYDRSVEIDIFPTPFFMDINNDHKVDFIAANNTATGLEDYNCAWQYKNTGTQENPIFEFEKKTFMVDQMIDLGSGNRPVFVDVNNDGLEDLICATNGKYGADEKDNRLVYYQNIGTSTHPKFKLSNEDWLNFSTVAPDDSNFSPCFGDLDGDGDQDLLIGVYSGAIYYAENTASENNPMQFLNFQKDYMGIDVGLLASPTIVDLNRDGLMDLVIGERNSNLNYFQNMGTSENPSFESDPDIAPNTKVLGNVLVRKVGFSSGNSVPRFLDIDGKYQLICGSENQGIFHFNDIENNIYGDFHLEQTNFGDQNFGESLNPTLADINHDGKYDLLIGNRRGGISTLTTNFKSPFVGINDIQSPIDFTLYPNPTHHNIWIEFNSIKKANLTIFDCLGNEILNFNHLESKTNIPLDNISNGTYFVKLSTKNGAKVQKLVILR